MIDDNKNKSESIKPSARASIHSHNCCPFDERYIMGRQGLIKNKYKIVNANPPLNQHDEDIDEVDNIMSKFAHPVQIPARNQKKAQRRSSLDLNTQDCTSDDSDDSCSDQDSTEKTFYSTQSSYVTKNISRNETYKQGETSYSSTKSQHSTRQNNNTLERNSVYQWLIVPVILAVLGVIYFAGINSRFQNKLENDNPVTDHNKYGREKFYKDLYNIGENYKVSEDTILKLQIGISLISQKHDTDSFMFVYNSKATNFAIETFNDFVNEVASVTARYLRNGSSTVRHIVVDSSRLSLRDSTELIEKYRADVTKSGVLLLMGIDTLPSSLAMALHYYCDEYNPLVKKSAIFSTLDLANCSDQKSTHAYIEKCLSKKWHSVPADNIGPLLTRVVSTVVDLTNVL